MEEQLSLEIPFSKSENYSYQMMIKWGYTEEEAKRRVLGIRNIPKEIIDDLCKLAMENLFENVEIAD